MTAHYDVLQTLPGAWKRPFLRTAKRLTCALPMRKKVGLPARSKQCHWRAVPVRIPKVAHSHAPLGTTIVRVERMSPAFVKYHLDDGRALHRLVRPEPHADPHDHPWSFETTILWGGYIEEVFTVHPDGGWQSAFIERQPGSHHLIDARHIHRIVGLPSGECWTLVRAGAHERKTMFWRFGETVERRAWNARRWSCYRSPGAGKAHAGRD